LGQYFLLEANVTRILSQNMECKPQSLILLEGFCIACITNGEIVKIAYIGYTHSSTYSSMGKE
jgi:hypothetical protein